MRTLLFLILSLFTTHSALADELSRPCAGPSSPQFPFRYDYRPGMPLVVYFPGGPGFGSMGRGRWPIPREFGAVMLDPRGVGANAAPAACADSLQLTTVDLAEDAVAVITKIQPKHLVLYGTSYGSAVATITAHLLEQRSFAGETTLLLEGVFGRALRPGEYAPPFIQRWDALFARLPANARELLSQPAPLGFAAHVWGGWIEEQLSLGAAPGALEARLTDQHAALRDELQQFQARPPVSQITRHVFKAIGCHELVPAAAPTDNNFFLDRGRLIESPGNLCEGIALDRPFDARQWPLKRTSILYFIGPDDPVTFEALSQYHIAANPDAKKQIFRVPNAAHAPLQFTLASCAEQIVRMSGFLGAFDEGYLHAACEKVYKTIRRRRE